MISVVIPVFNAFEELVACLDSVLAHTPAEAKIIILDDSSTDKRIQPFLSELRQSRDDSWVFLENPVNRGFVHTANRGMQVAAGDVVLLNSDTVVTPGWIEGLARCLASDSRIATATPWSNNGEIVSIPAFCQSNPVPREPDRVAQCLLSMGEPEYPEVPTAVGFCMAVSAHAIEEIGIFDEALFGMGYGEENDFSMRAAQAGWRNVLCDDVYVVHKGGCSFGPLGLAPNKESMQRLLSRHPGYLELVQEFIERDPFSSRRERVLNGLERQGVSLG